MWEGISGTTFSYINTTLDTSSIEEGLFVHESIVFRIQCFKTANGLKSDGAASEVNSVVSSRSATADGLSGRP